MADMSKRAIFVIDTLPCCQGKCVTAPIHLSLNMDVYRHSHEMTPASETEDQIREAPKFLLLKYSEKKSS